MQNRNPRSDPQDRPNSTNQPGVSVPAKGDSSGSHFPVDPDATLVDFPQATSDPEATFVDSDATLVDVDATLVDAGSVRGSPAPYSGPRNARLQV
ncbi:MAG: hypothetical protein WBG40_19350, partial [Candidatus Sulfotelmatobacter sp.]